MTLALITLILADDTTLPILTLAVAILILALVTMILAMMTQY